MDDGPASDWRRAVGADEVMFGGSECIIVDRGSGLPSDEWDDVDDLAAAAKWPASAPPPPPTRLIAAPITPLLALGFGPARFAGAFTHSKLPCAVRELAPAEMAQGPRPRRRATRREEREPTW